MVLYIIVAYSGMIHISRISSVGLPVTRLPPRKLASPYPDSLQVFFHILFKILILDIHVCISILKIPSLESMNKMERSLCEICSLVNVVHTWITTSLTVSRISKRMRIKCPKQSGNIISPAEIKIILGFVTKPLF